MQMGRFCVGKSRLCCGSLKFCVRMRAPFAPTMSRGSRATQVKPEALIIQLRVYP
jgi:hypothetical protein